jgi:hypothetical protein
MQSLKLSVTIRAHLAAKYDARALRSLDAGIAAWIAADRHRGFRTIHVALDDAAAMRRLGTRAVRGRVTANKVKVAIDGLCAKLHPDYLILFGAGDVVPFFQLPNPSFSLDGDDERTVPSDNPYACSRRFVVSSRKSYLVPDRVVGRIPDVPSSTDPSAFLDYLHQIRNWAPHASRSYRDPYMICTRTWREAGQQAARKIGASAARLLVSPPSGDRSQAVRRRLAANLHMIKCHGDNMTAEFFGQQGSSYPVALSSRTLRGRVAPRTVVGAMCCYGAQVFSPHDPFAAKPGEAPIASTYLRGGAYGFAGSTNTAWVGDADMQCADWIVSGFLENVLDGASLGRALLDSKQSFVEWVEAQGHSPDRAEEKTLLQFMLLGDPAIHAVTAASPAAAHRPRSAALAVSAIRAEGAVQERHARRRHRVWRGKQLCDALPRRAPAPAVARRRAPGLARSVRDLLGLDRSRFGIPRRAPKVDVTRASRASITQPAAPKALGSKRVQSYDYYWVQRRMVRGRKQVQIVRLATDARGTPLRASVVQST